MGIFFDELPRRSQIFFRKNGTFLFPLPDFGQLSIFKYQLKDSLATIVLNMHMNGFVFIREELENNSKIFVDCWHKSIPICFDFAKLQLFPNIQAKSGKAVKNLRNASEMTKFF